MEYTMLSSVMGNTKVHRQYDEYCKKVLSNKQILAYLLKSCVKEYKAMPLTEIVDYVEGKMEGESISGRNIEDLSVSGAPIYYDLLFEGKQPSQKTMLINIEAQYKDDPGYPLLTRGMYYASRLFAGQKNANRGFQHSSYGESKKVYSIWICLNHAKKKDGTINVYEMKEQCVGVEWNEQKEVYDKMAVVVLYLAKTKVDKEAPIHTLLRLLFFNEEEVDKKKERLEKEFGIVMSKTFQEEVECMCNFSEYWIETGLERGMQRGLQKGMQQGLQQGRQQGRKQGLEQGELQTTLKFVEALLATGKFTLNEIIAILPLSKKLQKEVRNTFQQDL